MRITVVREADFKINEKPVEVIFEKDSDHVPNHGDMIKVGHNLNGFNAFTVEKRVFRSLPGKAHDAEAFQEVILLVSEQPVAVE